MIVFGNLGGKHLALKVRLAASAAAEKENKPWESALFRFIVIQSFLEVTMHKIVLNANDCI